MTAHFPDRPAKSALLSCEQAIDRLAQLIDNELAHHQVQPTQDHLSACPSCAGEHRIRLMLKRLVKEACFVPAPQGLRERVTASLSAAG